MVQKFKKSIIKLHQHLDQMSCLNLLFLRIVVGFVFLEAGLGKLKNLQQVTEYFQSIGIPYAHLQAPFVASVEFFGGAAILLGFLTRFVSIPLAFTMVVALVTAKKADINSVSDLFGMSEFLYIGFFTTLLMNGAGFFSVDSYLKRKVFKIMN